MQQHRKYVARILGMILKDQNSTFSEQNQVANQI